MSSLYRIPQLLERGQTAEGVPFSVLRDRLTGQVMIAYDFEALRRKRADPNRPLSPLPRVRAYHGRSKR